MAFKKGVSGNPKGRPKGSRNRAPDRGKLVDLLDRITDEIDEHFDKLSLRDKLSLLSAFKHLYTGEITDEEIEHFRTVTVQIISNKDEANEN